MKTASMYRITPRVALCAAAALTLTPGLQAEKPVVAHTPTLHRVAAVADTTEPGEAPQSTPTPPTPPDRPAFKDDLFAGTEKFSHNASEATEVNMDPDSLNMVGGPDAHRARRTLLNVVHHYEYDKPGMYNLADVEEFRRKLEGGDWHCSVHTRDLKSGESTDICNRRRSDGLIERAIITIEPKELTFIHTIQRGNGEGGRMMGADGPDMSMMPGFSDGALAASLAPEIQADVAASVASMAASSAAMKADMLASTAHLRAELGHLQVHPQIDEKRMREEMDRAMKSLQNTPELQHLPEQLPR